MDPQRRYLVKEIFGPTIQGEGAHAGRPCVFLRFAVCNLRCTWCDTDFAPLGARRLGSGEIADELLALDVNASRLVIVTGGEPTLQWDRDLAERVRTAGFRVHMESNGTRELAAPVDWLTVSPKPQFHQGEELASALPIAECKVVVDDTVDIAVLAGYEQRWSCEHWFVQPCMDARYLHHLQRALELVHARPRWRLSLQLHKILRVP
jgi:organic radical activating enzyme